MMIYKPLAKNEIGNIKFLNLNAERSVSVGDKGVFLLNQEVVWSCWISLLVKFHVN